MNEKVSPSPSKEKPRILLLGSQMAVAGAQHVLLDQADWLDRLGYPVMVAFLYDRDGLQSDWQSGRNFPIINLDFRKNGVGKIRNLFSFLSGVSKLNKLLRKQHFQVIETFTHHSNLIGCPLAWLAGVPARIASHHGPIERFPGWANRIHTWMVNSGIATKLVVVSREVSRQALEDGIRQKRLALILNGVEVQAGDLQEAAKKREELLPYSDGKLILSVGRLTYQKAHTFLLQAMSEVIKQNPHTILAVAGEGLLRPDLEAEIRQLGLQDNVRLLGVRPDVSDLMLAADIFCLSSRWEGLPLVILEAMRAGLPILTTDVQGIREALNDGECGMIVPVEDPQALSVGLLQLISDDTLRRKLGQAAQDRFQQAYTLDIMMSHYLELMDPNTSSDC